MPTFITEAEIIKYAQSLIKQSQTNKNSNVRKVVGEANTHAVETQVYSKYDPRDYDRRGRNGGLADERNIEVTSVQSSGNTTQVILENLTEGNDSMRGKQISDGIEQGDKSMWYNPNGAWSDPRPYVDFMAEQLRNGTELTEALKRDLKNIGLDVV